MAQRGACQAPAGRPQRVAEPDYLDPPEHGQLVLKALQEARRFGYVLSSEIVAMYPDICARANVAEISERDMLRELAKLVKRSRLTIKAEDGRPLGSRRAYLIPKPKAAEVVGLRKVI